MEDFPFFSVLIPVYNDGKTVERCINSVLKQSFSNIELIICDDASTDNTPGILKSYIQKDPRIKIITHEKNMRALIARNDLIRSARAKYCIFVDADDEILPGFLARAYQILMKKHYDIVQFSYEYYREDNESIPVSAAQKKAGIFPFQELF